MKSQDDNCIFCKSYWTAQGTCKGSNECDFYEGLYKDSLVDEIARFVDSLIIKKRRNKRKVV